MKQHYQLVLELEAVIDETIPVIEIEKQEFFNELLETIVKDEQLIYHVYRHYLMADLEDGDHYLKMKTGVDGSGDLRHITFTDFLKTVIPKLSPKAKKHFETVFRKTGDQDEKHFDLLLDRFGALTAVKVCFTRK